MVSASAHVGAVRERRFNLTSTISDQNALIVALHDASCRYRLQGWCARHCGTSTGSPPSSICDIKFTGNTV